MVEGLSNGELSVLNEAIRGLQSVAENGNVHAESTLAFLYASGSGVQQSDAKAFLYHHFAAHGGNLQSKMALAYSYSRQQVPGLSCVTIVCHVLISNCRIQFFKCCIATIATF